MTNAVIFLDQSTNICGYAIFKKKKLVTSGIIRLNKANTGVDVVAHTERRQYLISQINILIEQYEINTVVYEGIFQSNNPKFNNPDTFKKLSKVQGSIEDYSLHNQLKFEEFPVAQWRSYLPLKYNHKGKGQPPREKVKEAVVGFIDKKFPDLVERKEDEKEAIAMGLAWFNKTDCFIGEPE